MPRWFRLVLIRSLVEHLQVRIRDMLLYILPIHEILRTQNRLWVGFGFTGGYGWCWDHITGYLGRLRHTKEVTEGTVDACKEAVSSVQLVRTAHANMRKTYTF